MMKVAFNDFVLSFSALSVLNGSSTARFIYDNIIWRDDIRAGMVTASDLGIPALSVCATEIENYCANNPNCDLNISNRTVKQSLGRAIKCAMEPLGYTVLTSGNRLPSCLNLQHFKTATSYNKTNVGTDKINVSITSI